MLWNTIATLPGCRTVEPKNYSRLYLFKTSLNDTGWLIGPYKNMISLATDLRGDPALREFLSAHRVRLGLRDTDVPPAGIDRQIRYGSTIQGANSGQDFTAERVNPLAPPVGGSAPTPVNRKTDREENVKRFWDSQTPQSHHIVEFNNLETLGKSRRIGVTEMDYLNLPAVLLAAEFHQRYISAILKPAQHWGKGKLQSNVIDLYHRLYQGRGPIFDPLWQVSKVILRQAGLKIQ
jgi:hypothetical protein